MSIIVASINHQLADIDIRAKVAFHPEQMNRAFLFAREQGFAQMVILSTCNRVEVIAQSTCEGVRERLLHYLASFHQFDKSRLAKHIQWYQSDAAFEHLVRVASGLESMVMGEPQIFGQVKQAYQAAKQAGMIHGKLDFVFQQCFNTVKKIRHQTAIGHCPVSVAFSSIKLAKTFQITNPTILILGAGETGQLVLKHLSHLQPKKVTILNRTLKCLETQGELTFPVELKTLSQENLLHYSKEADIIIGTTASPTPIVNKAHLPQKRSKRLVCIDIAVPRDIAPEVQDLGYISLHCVDDIQKMINHNTLMRTQAAIEANTIIEEAVNEYNKHKQFKDTEQDLVSFRKRLISVKEKELLKAKQRLASGQNPEKVLEQFSRSIVNKLLHEPSSRLHKADEGLQSELLQSIKMLWG